MRLKSGPPLLVNFQVRVAVLLAVESRTNLPFRSGFAQLIDRDVILARILPCIRTLTTDASQHVRAALAKQISGLAPLLGKQATQEHLLPLFLQLLKDEFSEVRLHLIGKLEMVNDGEFRKTMW